MLGGNSGRKIVGERKKKGETHGVKKFNFVLKKCEFLAISPSTFVETVVNTSNHYKRI